ncbi:hypothetical protein [Halorubrum sp. Hd13]|uniref:hypothetical protein n=1 Tax=Halorubrum sp. Hd13 TaxID=1480728 RepID=UPI000B9992F2|nr:hypothetical protein [Halorubrum sp. Hd13]OYR44362.1 hypothetical protein DJ81_07390 [Halorubrum sp. Hd13]
MDDTPISRRRFAASGIAAAAVAAAGCLGGTSGDGEPGSNGADGDRVLRLSLSGLGDALRDRYVTDPEEADPNWADGAFEAVRNGTTLTTQYRKPFFSDADDPTYARHDGTYYWLDSVVVDEVAVSRPVLRLFEPAETSDGAAEPTSADALPAIDRRAVEIAHHAARARGNEGGMPVGLVRRGGYVYRRDDAAAESDLLAADGPDRVTVRDTEYVVEITEEEFHEPVYRATGERVADTPERMEAILRAEFVGARISRDDLSADARDLLLEAEADEYRESHPYSEAYREVLRALHERPYIDGNVRKDAGVDSNRADLCRYDDVYYDYQLRFVSL